MARVRSLVLPAALALFAGFGPSACADDPDIAPGLEWEPCDHGRSYVDGVCDGPAALETWTEASNVCASMIAEETGSRWRLPTPDEPSALILAHPEFDPARRWSNARSDDPEKKGHPIAIDHGGYPQDQDPGKKVRFRCVKD